MVLEAETSKIKALQSWWLVREGPSLFHSPHPVCSHLTEEGREPSGVSVARALIPFTKASPSRPNHSRRPHLPAPSHWGLGFNICIWGVGGRKHKHSVHHIWCPEKSIDLEVRKSCLEFPAVQSFNFCLLSFLHL